MRKLKIRVDNKNKATNQEIVDNLDQYTFQYALVEERRNMVRQFRQDRR